MLTKSEREMLIDPFGFNDSQEKVYRRNSYYQYVQLNSRFLCESSIEDIDKMEVFFLLDARNVRGIVNFRAELKYFTPEEGLLNY